MGGEKLFVEGFMESFGAKMAQKVHIKNWNGNYGLWAIFGANFVKVKKEDSPDLIKMGNMAIMSISINYQSPILTIPKT